MGLTHSRFYRPRDGQAWRYYLPKLVGDIWPTLKASWQRARRGWADCDTWSMDYWFCEVVPPMLRRLAEKHHGTPMDFTSDQDNWPKVLRQVADDLEAIDRWDAKWFGTGVLEDVFTDDFKLRDAPEAKAVLDACHKGELEAYDKVKAGLLGFYEWFFALWD